MTRSRPRTKEERKEDVLPEGKTTPLSGVRCHKSSNTSLGPRKTLTYLCQDVSFRHVPIGPRFVPTILGTVLFATVPHPPTGCGPSS